MATIINNLDYTFTPAEQQEIHNAAANAGVDTVYASAYKDTDNIFDFNTESGDYLFSIDVDADGSCVIFDRR